MVDLLNAVTGVRHLVAGLAAEVQTLAVRCPDYGIAGDGLMRNFGEMFGGATGGPVIDQAPLQFPK